MNVAVSEKSLVVLNYLQENHGTKMTAADIAEALGMEKKSVDGVVTSGLQRKGLTERIPAQIEVTDEDGNKKYKDVKFVAIDFTPTDEKENPVDVADNVYCATYKEQQPGYLAGYAAVKEGYTKIGFMGGMALPAVINYGYGYLQGANDAAKELNILIILCDFLSH